MWVGVEVASMSNETIWVNSFVNELTARVQCAALPGRILRVEAGHRFPYAYEVLAYRDNKPCQTHESRYQTDLLITEHDDQTWVPRVVIECKLGAVNTHDAITYSAKAATHKKVHPYLRYGILLGNWGTHPLPLRLIRHGAHFDFMASWQEQKASSHEWESLMSVLKSEIEASRALQELLSSQKKDKQKYTMLHRQLVLDNLVASTPKKT